MLEYSDCEDYNEYIIIGNDKFKYDTINALEYIKTMDNSNYSIVQSNIKTLLYIKTKYSHQFPKIFGVGDKSFSEYGVRFYASEIVRAAYWNHLEARFGSFRIYADQHIYNRVKILSIKKQLNAMHKLKCKQQRIDHLQSYLQSLLSHANWNY